MMQAQRADNFEDPTDDTYRDVGFNPTTVFQELLLLKNRSCRFFYLFLQKEKRINFKKCYWRGFYESLLLL
jgi:hypothetical protein